MKFNILFLFCLLTILPGCYQPGKSETKEEAKQSASDALIYAELNDLSTISLIQNTIKPLIDAVIKQELHLSDDMEFNNQNFPYAIARKNPWLTLYNLDGLKEGEEKLVKDSLDALQTQKINLNLTPHLAFMGDKQDQIAILVDDPGKSLEVFHENIKQTLHDANAKYQLIKGHDLYDVQKSERYPYKPHISIMPINSNNIKKFVSDSSKAEGVFNFIKQRIEKEVFPVVSKILTSKNSKFNLSSVCLYDISKKNCLKKYAMS